MAIDRSKSGGLTANAFGRDDVGVAAAMMVGKLSLAKQTLAKPWLSARLSVGGLLGAGAEALAPWCQPVCACLRLAPWRQRRSRIWLVAAPERLRRSSWLVCFRPFPCCRAAVTSYPGAAKIQSQGGTLGLLLLPLVPLLVLLSACGTKVVKAPFPVQTLADAGLQPLPAARLAACATALRLPPELARPADPSNFGQRQARDAFGRDVPNRPQLIVLHETVISAVDTVRYFATPHPRDDDQASYHQLIDRAGQRLRIVPDEGRAFGAGMAAFGDFTVRIRPASVGSLNNVALHLSLETPPDGRGDGDAHSGYTSEQYRVAAGQVLLWPAAWGIPMSRVTTHQAVDRSHSRRDPRSFRWDSFDTAWREAASRCGLTALDRERATI